MAGTYTAYGIGRQQSIIAWRQRNNILIKYFHHQWTAWITHSHMKIITYSHAHNVCMLKSLKIAEQNYFYVNFIDLLKFMGEHGRRKHLKFILKNMWKIIIITRTPALTNGPCRTAGNKNHARLKYSNATPASEPPVHIRDEGDKRMNSVLPFSFRKLISGAHTWWLSSQRISYFFPSYTHNTDT